MGWREHAFSIDLTITGEDNGEFRGSGSRSFYFVNDIDAPDSLPSIGDDFVYPALNETYPGIKAVSIQREHEFIEDGYTSCNSGIKATVSYSSDTSEESALDPGEGTESEAEIESNWSGETRTVTVPGDYWVFYTGDEEGEITNYDLGKIVETPVANDIPLQTATGTFSLNHDFPDFVTFKSWVTGTFPTKAGKLNDSTFYGFPPGSVLCNSFSKSITRNAQGQFVHRVSLELQWMVIPGVNSDPWQKLPGTPDYAGNVEGWYRVVRGERSPGAGVIAANVSGLYEYADFDNLFGE